MKTAAVRTGAGAHRGAPLRRVAAGLLAATLVALPAAAFPAPVAAPSMATGADRIGIDLEAAAAAPFTTHAPSAAIRNPHDFPCEECHAGEAPAGAPRPLATGDDSIALCTRCHPDSNLHPVGVPPGAVGGADAAVGTPAVPLGAGALAGKITCLTCHYVHRAKGFERHLLRTVFEKGRNRIEALCAACHGARLQEKSPHAGTGESCRLCHMNRPQAGSGIKTLAPNVQAICNFCHSALDDRHFVALDPFTDEYVFSAATEAEIPRLGGRYTCISCHDPHASGSRKKLLREPYLNLAGISRKVNPHWKNVMCVSCHEGEPAKGVPALKEGGDPIRLCYRCHAFKYSRSDIHPVNCRPSAKIELPPGMPLRDGRLTCATCHDSALQEGGERADSERRRNPKFLRGGFTSRGEFCSRCHPRRLMGMLNPHEQLDARGEPDRVKCLFCHSSLPEGKAAWVVRGQFDEETVTDLCLLCHEPRYRDEHPMAAPHLGRPSRAAERRMETAEERVGVPFPLLDGSVTCVTCHNPHQAGVGGAAAAGAAGRRLRVGAEICAGCHEK